MADDPMREEAPQRFYGFDEDISCVAVPAELSILPLRGVVIFPSAIVPLLISRGASLRLVEEALAGDRMLGLFSQKNPEDEHPDPEGLYSRGTAGRILKMLKYPDGSVRILVQGLKRIEVTGYTQREPYFKAKVRLLQDTYEPSKDVEAMQVHMVNQFAKFVSMIPYLPDELQVVVMNIKDPGKASDLIASNLNISLEEKQDLLSTLEVQARLEKLSAILNREIELLELGHKIQSQVQSELNKNQKEFYLRQQMQAIQKELGEGAGKTSLGRSIARAMGRKFVRISLGGIRDEAEIRGHRCTYIGALPGRIVQNIRNGGSNNPLFMLDEIDKLGMDFRGDPASALLEVLDPEQNNTFMDHYLDVPFDLSKVMFVTTANVLDTIPPPLRDRMEVIELAGYTDEEKLEIAQTHLVPKQARQHGPLSDTAIAFEPEALRLLARGYTREAGVRNLEREIAAVCRKVARRHAEGHAEPVRVTPDLVTSFLGAPKFEYEELEERTRVPGVTVGLAWTPAGGDILFIEATRMKGKGSLTLTGQLGDVMKESAQAALSWVRSHAAGLGIAPDFWETSDVHVHVPAGA